MASPNLTDDELKQAAAEAGISPHELRMALAERHGGLPDRPEAAAALMGAPTRGVSATHVESRLQLDPKQALSSVRGSIERQTGKRGHNQGAAEADIVDDAKQLTYRIRSASDGANGALVRVDIDPSSGKGQQALAATGVIGVTATLVALGWLFGAMFLWGTGLGIGAVGGLLLARSMLKLRQATASANAIAAHALMEAEDKAPVAGQGVLPPASY